MLIVNNISKSFNPNEIVLDDISFEVNQGDLVTILGSNGSGKSTLLKILSGVYQPDTGFFGLGNRKLTRLPAYKISSYIHLLAQSREENLPSSLTLLELLMICLTNSSNDTRSLSVKNWERKALDILSPIGLKLEKKIHQQIKNFSGGEYQVISLVLMIELIKQSRAKENVLLLDEHTAHLDEKMELKVMDLTMNLIRDNSITTLMVTHDFDAAIRYSKRILLLKGGRICQEIDVTDSQPILIKHQIIDFFS